MPSRRYRATGIPLLDLVQEGSIGLIRAAEKFDWLKGFKFSTYATWGVRQLEAKALAKLRHPSRATALLTQP